MKITFDNKHNDMFRYGRKHATIAILKELIKKLKSSKDTYGFILDINGNRIGFWDNDSGNE